MLSTSGRALADYEPPVGSSLLSRIYDATCEVDHIGSPNQAASDSTLRAVLLAFLDYASRPYLSWLQEWLCIPVPETAQDQLQTRLGSDGVHVDDPYEEFFIAFQEGRKTGEDFWRSEWQFNWEAGVPSFIPASLAQELLHAGKYLRLLRTCQAEHPLFRTLSGGQATDRIKGMELRWVYLGEEVEKFVYFAV